MKQFFVFAITTFAVASAVQPHYHGHRHARSLPNSALIKRALKKEVVVSTEIVWELLGEGPISAEDAKDGIKNGKYAIVSGIEDEDEAEFLTIEANNKPGVFKEDETELTLTSSTAAISTLSPLTSSLASSTLSTTSSSSALATETSSSMLNYNNIDKEFPDGELPCDSFPNGYGAVAADWLGMDGWLGIQWGHSNIVTGISGDSCTPGGYCSYLCPEGYQKSQWPSRQGDSLESIGGLYCNNDGKLELTRPSVKTLCEKGKGGVYVKNKLSQTVFMCRTDYPGTEAMLIPIEVGPDGIEHDVTNPDQTWYKWDGKLTTAQYYINPAGLDRDNACVWDSAAIPDGAGDKAPTNFGTGMNDGITYFGLFPNAAVSSAILEYNVRISVDGENKCKLEDGVYSQSSSGCTGAAINNSKILIEFY